MTYFLLNSINISKIDISNISILILLNHTSYQNSENLNCRKICGSMSNLRFFLYCSASVRIFLKIAKELKKLSLLYPGVVLLLVMFLLSLPVLLVLLDVTMGFWRLVNIYWMYSGISKPKENTFFQRI